MTRIEARPPRILGSTQLYTAAIIIGSMLIPHVVLAPQAHWPAQAFTLHCLVVFLTFGLGLRAEYIERAAAAAPPQRKKTTKKPAKTDTLVWLDRSIAESGDR